MILPNEKATEKSEVTSVLEDQTPPPPYAASASSSAYPELPRSNHLSIIEKNRSIKGAWLIETALNIPTALLPPLEDGETSRANLRLFSHNGRVEANVSVVGNEPSRARIEAISKNGRVVVRVQDRANQKVSIRAFSHNGSVAVHLPADFHGPLRYCTHNGSVILSPAAQKSITTFSKTKKEASCFIGDWVGTKFGQGGEESEWEGDEVVLETKNGDVKVYLGADSNREGFEELNLLKKHSSHAAGFPCLGKLIWQGVSRK